MTQPIADDLQTLESSGNSSLLDSLRQTIEHLTQLLPTQGPIKVFVHHNTLHAFEDQNFERGVVQGLEVFGCEPYFSEQRYHEECEKGRIRREDVSAVLMEDLGEDSDHLIASFGTRYALRFAMLQFPIEQLAEKELQWVITETDVLDEFRREVDRTLVQRMVYETKQKTMQLLQKQDRAAAVLVRSEWDLDELSAFDLDRTNDWSEKNWTSFTLRSLWHVCQKSVRQTYEARPLCVGTETRFVRHRDVLAEWLGIDSDRFVNEYLIRFCSIYLDQGLSAWVIPDRDRGLWQGFLQLYATSIAFLPAWLKELPSEIKKIQNRGLTAIESIAQSLEELGVQNEAVEPFLRETLLALRGWAGMIWQMETCAPWTPRPAQSGTLVDFLAIRLLLDRYALKHVASQRSNKATPVDLSNLLQHSPIQSNEDSEKCDCLAFTMFQIAQSRGWTPHELVHLSLGQWRELQSEVEAFDSLERRRVLHRAYERKYRNAALDALIHHSERMGYGTESKRIPKFQVITCIDDREESFRRHLEEVEPACQTYGAAGFFGVVMYYRGASEAHYRPLCPINIVPKHYVREEPVFSASVENERREKRRRTLGRLTHQVHTGSRTIIGGIVTGILGSLATFPLVARVLAPRVTARVRDLLGGFVSPPSTELHLQRVKEPPGPEYESLGYSIPEMAAIVVRILQDIGLVQGFSPIVLFLGHGSSSLNNPHESAYNCGACSGGRGGPNARAFAWMANSPKVRKLVKDSGIDIPDDVRFVGGFHNTCNDRVDFFDLDLLPHTHRKLFREMESSIHLARQRNALERSRRFESASLELTPRAALEHVEERAEDLSQVRPEYNHATNALCFVGNRSWSRGLFLDRRAFLASYDPSIDDEQGRIVERILQAAIPVCGGISLEYYFSTVDPEGYGCGSKLPHNIASLAGVMTGAASDLRPGLSAQMVEIHEPLRILFVVETHQEAMKRIIAANPPIQRLVEGNWVQLAIFCPQDKSISIYHDGRFEAYDAESSSLAQASSSIDWFRGNRENLDFASIDTHWRAAAPSSPSTGSGP